MSIRFEVPRTKDPVANHHQGRFRVKVRRDLSNSSITGNSDMGWWLFLIALSLDWRPLSGGRPKRAAADLPAGKRARDCHDFGVNLQNPSAPRVQIPFTWWRGQVADAG